MASSYYTRQEAAAKLGVSQDEVMRTVAGAGIRSENQGGQMVFRAEDIDRLAAGYKRPSPGDSIFQSSSSGLFDVDDLMAELGTSSSAKQSAEEVGGLDEPTQGYASQQKPQSGALPVEDAGLDEATQPPARSPAAASPGDLDEPTAAPRRSRSDGGAVMSDSGLFDVKELVQESEAITSKPLVPDDSTIIESPTRRKGSGGAVMSDSGLFDVQEVVGSRATEPVPEAAPPAATRDAGAVMSDSGLFNVAHSVEQGGSEPVPPTPAFPSVRTPSASTGAVMSDSGLFDVRDLVQDTGRAQGVDAPTQLKAPNPFARPAGSAFQGQGAGQSDSGLFSAAEVEAAASASPTSPDNIPTMATKGITIFDADDFRAGSVGDASSQTEVMNAMSGPGGSLSGASAMGMAAPGGSGAGLRAPKAANEGTSLGNEVLGGLDSDTDLGAGKTRPLAASAIFGAQRPSNPNNQTEILNVPNYPSSQGGASSSGSIFGVQAPPTNVTEIMDPLASSGDLMNRSAAAVQAAFAGEELADGGDESTGQQMSTRSDIQPTVRTPTRSTTSAGMQASAMPGRGVAMMPMEEPDHFEPAFGFFLVLGLIALVFASLTTAFTVVGVKAGFINAFTHAGSAPAIIIAGVVCILLGLIGGFVYARQQS
jgi:hypothetical protein